MSLEQEMKFIIGQVTQFCVRGWGGRGNKRCNIVPILCQALQFQEVSFLSFFHIAFSLEVVLVKQAQEHHWSSVVKGDDRGTYVLVGEEAERVKEIHSRLEHLTSDKLVSAIQLLG